MFTDNSPLGSSFEEHAYEDNMPNRTLCDVLDALRKCHETRNFSYLPGLIEEAQNMANRMEAALYDQSDLEYARAKLKKLKKERKKLERKIEELKEELNGLD